MNKKRAGNTKQDAILTAIKKQNVQGLRDEITPDVVQNLSSDTLSAVVQSVANDCDGVLTVLLKNGLNVNRTTPSMSVVAADNNSSQCLDTMAKHDVGFCPLFERSCTRDVYNLIENLLRATDSMSSIAKQDNKRYRELYEKKYIKSLVVDRPDLLNTLLEQPLNEQTLTTVLSVSFMQQRNKLMENAIEAGASPLILLKRAVTQDGACKDLSIPGLQMLFDQLTITKDKLENNKEIIQDIILPLLDGRTVNKNQFRVIDSNINLSDVGVKNPEKFLRIVLRYENPAALRFVLDQNIVDVEKYGAEAINIADQEGYNTMYTMLKEAGAPLEKVAARGV